MPMKIHRDVPIPRPSSSKEYKKYASIAEEMEIGDCVETIDRKTTVGIKRALERLDRRGSERKKDGVLWVWRVQ